MNLLDALRQDDSRTYNGAITNSTSLSALLDLFFIAGASRNMTETHINIAFENAWCENPQLTAKLLFWARDIRGGQGERRFFTICMKTLKAKYPDQYEQLAIHIPEYGYWKDVFNIEEPSLDNLSWMAEALEGHEQKNLLAKWFPRSGKWFTSMHKYLKIPPKDFRKKLVAMTNVVETAMCQKQWDSITYEHVPSVAMKRYAKAFGKHDTTRFSSFLASVLEGKTKINSSVLYPYDIYRMFNSGQDHNLIRASWENLPNFLTSTTERIMPVCDVSGSMTQTYGQSKLTPMDISVSLGTYISERNEGIFKDAFITFSEIPELQYLKGDIINRFQQLRNASWGMNTNIQSVFRIILQKALEHDIPQEQMPTMILIISDMEFDQCARNTNNFNAIVKQYEEAGYILPRLVFWNVNGRLGNVPVSKLMKETALVSGASPSIITSVLGAEDFTPVGIMLKTLLSERYRKITIDE